MDLHEVQSDRTKSPWMTSVFVDDKQVDFKIDSGADVTVMPYDTLLSLDLHTKLDLLLLMCEVNFFRWHTLLWLSILKLNFIMFHTIEHERI